MTAKPPVSAAAIARAGVPLARAQRLAARTGASEPNRLTPVAVLGVATFGLVAVAAVVPGGGVEAGAGAIDLAPTLALATAPAVPAVPDMPVPIAAEPDSFADLPLLMPEEPAPRPEPVAAVRSAPVMPCIARVQDRLATLHETTRSDAAVPVQRDHLTALVQATLDCGTAALDIEGSIELADSEIADIRVSWTAAESRLVLTVVDGGAAGDVPETFADDGLPVDFVIR